MFVRAGDYVINLAHVLYVDTNHTQVRVHLRGRDAASPLVLPQYRGGQALLEMLERHEMLQQADLRRQEYHLEQRQKNGYEF